jgi:hypothetical protein
MEFEYTIFIYRKIASIFMSQIKIWMALTVLGGLFLLIGMQSLVYAQGNDTSMMGNATNATSWAANATNATSMANDTGNISGIGGQGP